MRADSSAAQRSSRARGATFERHGVRPYFAYAFEGSRQAGDGGGVAMFFVPSTARCALVLALFSPVLMFFFFLFIFQMSLISRLERREAVLH